MGLFTPRISPHELRHVQNRMRQLHESIQLINTTIKPDVFFHRLHFTLDILLDLQQYEKYGIFKGSRPTDDYSKLLHNLEPTVDDFITRALSANLEKVSSLKTASARIRNRKAFATTLLYAFDNANTFWSGSYSLSKYYPHYVGPLYTNKNYQRVQHIHRAAMDL